MSDSLNSLYQEVILDHNKNPRNFTKLEDCTNSHEGFNPVCGDHIYVYVKLDKEGKKIEDISFQGVGCAISKSSASMMTEALKGKTVEEAKSVFSKFQAMLKDKKVDESLGKLEIFSGVWKFPARIKCANLAWHTFMAALDGKTENIKTE